jgi:hypothetical protein
MTLTFGVQLQNSFRKKRGTSYSHHSARLHTNKQAKVRDMT